MSRLRILGNGLKVSAVGLGCMGFTHAYGRPTDEEEATAAIRQAADLDTHFLIRQNVILESGKMGAPHTTRNWSGKRLMISAAKSK